MERKNKDENRKTAELREKTNRDLEKILRAQDNIDWNKVQKLQELLAKSRG